MDVRGQIHTSRFTFQERVCGIHLNGVGWAPESVRTSSIAAGNRTLFVESITIHFMQRFRTRGRIRNAVVEGTPLFEYTECLSSCLMFCRVQSNASKLRHSDTCHFVFLFNDIKTVAVKQGFDPKFIFIFCAFSLSDCSSLMPNTLARINLGKLAEQIAFTAVKCCTLPHVYCTASSHISATLGYRDSCGPLNSS
jgi:hypothetical protein